LVNICHEGPGFFVSGVLEHVSARIWVNEYNAADPAALQNFLKETALQRGMGKIILPAREDDGERLQGNGFVAEGTIEGYYGGTPAIFLAAFTRPERGISLGYNAEMEMLKKILRHKRVEEKKYRQVSQCVWQLKAIVRKWQLFFKRFSPVIPHLYTILYTWHVPWIKEIYTC
jgi:hypothetical protein